MSPTQINHHKNVYTDAPRLHPNLILGSLHLLCWLFFHPAAWRHHISVIDPTLPLDFCLVQLTRQQWRRPALWRLLIQGHLILPALVSLLVGLLLGSWGSPNLGIGMALSLTSGITIGLAIGLPSSVAVGIVGGTACSVASGLAIGAVDPFSGNETVGIIIGILGGGAIGVMGSVTANITSQQRLYSLTRQMGGIVVGVILGIAAFGLAITFVETVGGNILGSLAVGVVGGVAVGGAIGLAIGWRIHRWSYGLIIGIGGGLTFCLAIVLAVTGIHPFLVSVGISLILASAFCALFAMPYVLAERVAGAWAGAVAGVLGVGGGWIAFLSMLAQPIWPNLTLAFLSLLLGLTMVWWRPVILLPLVTVWNRLIYRMDERGLGGGPSRLYRHAAFWDEHQFLPLLGLDEHLLLVLEQNPVEGQQALSYLATSRQRWAAQAAQIEVDARELERCDTVATIGQIHRRLAAGELASSISALLRSFSRLSQDIEAALQQESAFNQRLALSAVEDRLDGLLRELTRSSEPYAVRFRPIATQWRQTVAAYVSDLTEAVESRQEIDSPYIIGVPLTQQQEIFVGRTNISARIEQLLLDRRRPPLLLYGQRRMGKTSLLNNLGRLLPSTIVPMFVDLQGPASRASDYAGFLYNLGRGMISSARQQRNLSLPALSRESLAKDPFTHFDEWLDAVEVAIDQHTALLALDEFEALDKALTDGQFQEADIFGMLRHLIQHRPRFKVLLAGSHTLDEFQRWASYLINVQVVPISFLTEAEARHLIEQPVKDFALRYEPEASRRVIELTGCHPFLIQLLCAEIVALKNEQEPSLRRLAQVADVEAAVPEALNSGSFFFADMARNQVDDAGRELLALLAKQGEGVAVDRQGLAGQTRNDNLERTLSHLCQRELIAAAEDGYRFQVELIRRWFAERY